MWLFGSFFANLASYGAYFSSKCNIFWTIVKPVVLPSRKCQLRTGTFIRIFLAIFWTNFKIWVLNADFFYRNRIWIYYWIYERNNWTSIWRVLSACFKKKIQNSNIFCIFKKCFNCFAFYYKFSSEVKICFFPAMRSRLFWIRHSSKCDIFVMPVVLRSRKFQQRTGTSLKP